MDKYDTLFDDTAPDDSVFTDKGALDPLGEPEDVVARDHQERELATLLTGIEEGYLPTTVSIYGPPGTGKTLTTRRLCTAYAERTDRLAVEYVNLKESRSLFSAANEIHFELTGTKKKAYEGLDGVFEGIWETLAEYPDWTVLILDEIDHIKHDSNYDPNDFFYRLLRGEGKLKRDIKLSAWLLSNEVLDVDLRFDSRVESAMSDEEVFFPPYNYSKLKQIVEPRLERAFRDGGISDHAVNHGIETAAIRWSDARKALTLFRQAGETANEIGLDQVNEACLERNIETTDKESTVEKLLELPGHHFLVLLGAASWTDRTGEIIQPVTTEQVRATYTSSLPVDDQLGTRALRETIADLELMGLVETWVESKGSNGRAKQIETTFDPNWVVDITDRYFEDSELWTKESD
ncbi:Cdc6/Cdc18 family protein [Halococcus thailandensis]|uniref:ORC1-type DNA replication protein n=1 Tax=Halococcus thailandensis JCM 13552 TaxID=1227457 RepID=M0N345_9EURY|nr:AAA family ATPase [Halococcus thailandensis]EMA52301.1 cell division control protein 6 [Halococcus thailandensis JCM 13552]